MANHLEDIRLAGYPAGVGNLGIAATRGYPSSFGSSVGLPNSPTTAGLNELIRQTLGAAYVSPTSAGHSGVGPSLRVSTGPATRTQSIAPYVS